MIYDIFFAVCKWNFSCDCLLLKLRPVSLSRALPVDEMYSVFIFFRPRECWPGWPVD